MKYLISVETEHASPMQYYSCYHRDIIESVDSVSRDERDAPLQMLEYLVLGTLSRILNTTIVFYG